MHEEDKPQGLTDLEKAEVTKVTLELAASLKGDAVWRKAIELPEGVDKQRLVLLGLLPLIQADARKSVRVILWLTADSTADARTKLRIREFFPLLGQAPEVMDWYRIVPIPENGFKSLPLDKVWIIGDLDWTDQPRPGRQDEIVKALNRVLTEGSCPALLVHQKGKTPIAPFPPAFGTGGGGCFVATAVYGGADCPEVRALRRFRDERLRRSLPGRAFIRLYARLGPKLAAQVSRRPACRPWLRRLLDRAAAICGGRC